MAGGGSASRRVFAGGLWAAALVVVSGCGMFDFGRMPLVPGTRWQVMAVDGQPLVNNGLLLTIDRSGEQATLRGDCASALFDVVSETALCTS